MKKNLLFLFIILLPVLLKAQITNVTVETYYISDANDATDTTDGRTLAEGSKTYRVYLEITPGSRVKKIYGDALHTLRVSSTDTFFNNINRPTAYFGYLINKSWFSSNPTIALDSWLTLGMATKTHYGVLKTSDPDGSFVGGTYNSGGSSGIPAGLLANTDAAAGIPLTTSDGLNPTAYPLGLWFDDGFRDGTGTDTTIFGSVNSGTQYISNSAFLQQAAGVVGAPADSNKVLVAQLTTKGEISFELNIEMLEPGSSIPVKYVANFAAGESTSDTLKSLACLTYPQLPPACGCTDPDYVEFNSTYSCSVSDSCKNKIVYGCMDPLSCNYNPLANFNIPSLCCYPGSCKDRDIAVVCPDIASQIFRIYPNPAKNQITFEVPDNNERELRYEIYNVFGRKVSGTTLNALSGIFDVDVSQLHAGVYMFRLYKGDGVESQRFLKQ